MKEIIQIGSPILEKKSIEVKDPKAYEIQVIIRELISICKKYEKRTAGLSAPQIGKNIRLFIARRVDLEEKLKDKKQSKEIIEQIWEPIINPKIIKVGKRQSVSWEGCLSVGMGDKAIFGPVMRPSFVKIEYLDRYGTQKELTAVDFLAHIIQHEYDHLEGIMFIKHVQNPKNLWTSKELDEYLKKHQDFPEIV